MRRRLIHQTIFLDAQIDLGILLVSVIISLSAHLVTVADRKIMMQPAPMATASTPKISPSVRTWYLEIFPVSES